MVYQNKKLNIQIENSQFFEVVECDGYVELKKDGQIPFKVYKNSTVHAFGSSTVHAFGSSTIYAFGSSTIYAFGSSTVHAYGSSTVHAYGSSTVHAYGSSTVRASGSSTVRAYGSSTVRAYGSSTVRAYDSSTVRAYGSSTVHAYGSSTVHAYGSSTVHAQNSSTVHAQNSSTVHASGFSVIFKKSVKCMIDAHNHFGAVIGQVFKTKSKMRVYKKLGNGAIAELEIPRGKVFQSEYQGKCRTESAKVISITSVDGQINYTEGYSNIDPGFIYRVGKIVRTDYNPEIEECSTGIHFFLTRQEAEEYEL